MATNCAYRYKMKKYTDEQLKSFSVQEWVEVLQKSPELADKCTKWEDFRGNDWEALLSLQPQFADRCDKVNGWAKFSSDEWEELIPYQPQFADKQTNTEENP